MSKQTKLLAFAALAMLYLVTPVKANISQFLGNWQNINSNNRGVNRIMIRRIGSTVRLHVWASCAPNPCDWGTTNAVAYGRSVQSPLPQQAIVLRAQYNQNFAHRQVIVRPAGNRLRVEVLTQFTSGNRANYVDAGMFHRVMVGGGPGPGGALPGEDCVGFNFATTHAARVQGRWKLVDGHQWILDFGNKRNEALRSAQIVKRYRFNEQCFIKRPNPSMTYWLVNHHSASGPMPGEDCVGFNPNTIQASHAGGIWRVADGNHAMFAFPNQAQTVFAVKVIKHYGFTRSCFVGRPNPSMSYLRR